MICDKGYGGCMDDSVSYEDVSQVLGFVDVDLEDGDESLDLGHSPADGGELEDAGFEDNTYAHLLPTGRVGRRRLPDHMKFKQDSENAVKTLNHWHCSLVDYLILHPKTKMGEMAEAFGVTLAWMSRVMNTDLFRTYYNERMADHRKNLTDKVINTAGEVAFNTLHAINQKVESQGAGMKMRDLTNAAELSGKMLGVITPAQKGGGAQATQVNLNFGSSVSPSLLAEARKTMHKVGENNSAELEAEIISDLTEDTDDENVNDYDSTPRLQSSG